MKYLFYDLEFATCMGGNIRICEFGYVLTNEHFDILDKGLKYINPNIPGRLWDWYALKNVIKKDKSEFLDKPTFEQEYSFISNLFKEADYVFGHTNDGDAEGLNCECKRYNLPSIDHVFYDIKYLYRELYKVHNDKSLGNMCLDLGVEMDDILHQADSDALFTMKCLQKMVENSKLSLEQLLAKYPLLKNESKDYKLKYNSYQAINDSIIHYASSIKSINQSDILKDKIILTSKVFESYGYKIKYLIKLIIDNGGKYASDVLYCNLYIDDEQVKDMRRDILKEANVEIVSLDSFLKLLNMKTTTFEKNVEAFKEEMQEKRNLVKNPKRTLADEFQRQGISKNKLESD